jgi:hypothetical protein
MKPAQPDEENIQSFDKRKNWLVLFSRQNIYFSSIDVKEKDIYCFWSVSKSDAHSWTSIVKQDVTIDHFLYNLDEFR